MTDQKSTDAALSTATAIYYEKKVLEDFVSKAIFYEMAPQKTSIPDGSGNQVYFTRWKKITPLYADNSDQFTATQMYISAETVSCSLHERDGYVQLSRFSTLTIRCNLLINAIKQVKIAATLTLDKLVRNDIGIVIADVANASSVNHQNLAIDGGTLNSTGKTARIWSHDKNAAGDRFPVYANKTRLAQSALVTSIAKTALTMKTIQHAVSVLTTKNVPAFGDGNYRIITHPEAAYQITTQAGFKGWISPTDNSPAKNNPTQVGVVAGARIMTSTIAFKYPLSADTLSTGSGNLYATLIFGEEAYGVTEIAGESGKQGFNFFLKESGPQTTSDPTNKKKQAAFSILAVAKVLNKSAGLWVLSTSVV